MSLDFLLEESLFCCRRLIAYAREQLEADECVAKDSGNRRLANSASSS